MAIRYHHAPSRAPDKYRLIVDSVYLADMLCGIELGRVIFEQIDGSVLARFNITNQNQIEKIINVFSKGFMAEKS